MNNYEKITNSSREQFVEFFKKGCGRTCPCFDYCHAQTDDDCRKTIRDWLGKETYDDTGTG